ncbi:hypothetical protein APICC_07468 [Apis cerana cerana]|uniref:Uncharacterized protein n=1 Tax=Apis cerana cerana TaxID=94128 RepID=A0A2A3E0K5_APICC|nr:hypothetical protein APICC_07468 [Apis cerana cerana]
MFHKPWSLPVALLSAAYESSTGIPVSFFSIVPMYSESAQSHRRESTICQPPDLFRRGNIIYGYEHKIWVGGLATPYRCALHRPCLTVVGFELYDTKEESIGIPAGPREATNYNVKQKGLCVALCVPINHHSQELRFEQHQCYSEESDRDGKADTEASQQGRSAGDHNTGPNSDSECKVQDHAPFSSPRPDTSAASRPSPLLRANPYSEVMDPICRLPLLTLIYRLKALYLRDLLRIWVRRDTSTWLSPGFLRKENSFWIILGYPNEYSYEGPNGIWFRCRISE